MGEDSGFKNQDTGKEEKEGSEQLTVDSKREEKEEKGKEKSSSCVLGEETERYKDIEVQSEEEDKESLILPAFKGLAGWRLPLEKFFVVQSSYSLWLRKSLTGDR